MTTPLVGSEARVELVGQVVAADGDNLVLLLLNSQGLLTRLNLPMGSAAVTVTAADPPSIEEMVARLDARDMVERARNGGGR